MAGADASPESFLVSPPELFIRIQRHSYTERAQGVGDRKMEVELEPRVKTLTYKVKAMSRESPAQKATHVLDTDLRNHWSAGTNMKEWILLELDVCMLIFVLLSLRLALVCLDFMWCFVVVVLARGY